MSRRGFYEPSPDQAERIVRINPLTRFLCSPSPIWRVGLATIMAATFAAIGSVPNPASGTPIITPKCGWYFQLGGTQINLTYPDAGARYWGSILPIPTGGHIEIKGEFPHARYFSLTTYTAQTQAIDGITDSQIVPDPGSTNPFRPGANRTATKRSYTLRVVAGQAPAVGRAQNTIYTTSTDGTKSAPPLFNAGMGLRIYLPDTGTGDTGGVALPQINLVSADGTRRALPGCQVLNVPKHNIQQALAASGEAVPLVGPGLLGQNPVHWRRYTNAVSAVLSLGLDNMLTGSFYDQLAAALDSILPTGGFFEAPDNKYLLATASREFGQVLQLRGTKPTTPRTASGERVMGSGQLRYWSMCTFSQASSLYNCANDEDVPNRADNNFVVVASTAAARPANARRACGVAWIPLGPVPQTFLMMRNMLPSPTFTHAVQNSKVGTEKQTLGAYYPTSTYFKTTQDFEALGCPVR